MFERPPRQSSAAGLIVTTNGQKQTRETFTTGLSYQDRNDARAVIQTRITSTAAHTRAAPFLAAIYPTNTQYRWLSFRGYDLFLYRRRQILFLVIPTCHGLFYLLPIKFWIKEKPFSFVPLWGIAYFLLSLLPHTGCMSNELNPIAKVVIFSLLQYFSLLFFYNNTQIAFFVSYFLK